MSLHPDPYDLSRNLTYIPTHTGLLMNVWLNVKGIVIQPQNIMDGYYYIMVAVSKFTALYQLQWHRPCQLTGDCKTTGKNYISVKTLHWQVEVDVKDREGMLFDMGTLTHQK